jgi:hypothetical protein
MLCRSLLLALIAALVAVAPSAAAEQTRVKSYCSPSRDVCYGIFKTGSVYSFRLTLAKKYFSRYQVCVTWRQGTTRLGPPLTFYLPAPI